MGKKAETRANRGRIVLFWEPWPIFEVWTVSFCFSFSSEFWLIHWYEVMIKSRRNERTQRRTKIGRRSNNFRYWTKGFVRKKKKRTREEDEDNFLKKKKKKRERRTQRSRVCAKTNSTLAQQINSKHKLHQIKKTKTQITVTRIFVFCCCYFFFFFFFFFSFFFLLMELCNFLFFAEVCVSLSFFRL